MKTLKSLPLYFLMSILFLGCKDDRHWEIVPLYKTVTDYKFLSREARDSVMMSDSTELKAFFEVLGFNSVNDTTLIGWSMSAPVKIFTPDVDSVYPSLIPLEKELGSILYNAEEANLNFPDRKYVAVVWGRPRSIMFADSCMLIALNHYLGSGYPGYSHWPLYVRMDKTTEHLPYDIAEALVCTQYPYSPSDNATALTRMIYEGVIVFAKMQLVENALVTEALGYNIEQIDWLEDNHKEVWTQLIGANMIYDTSENVINKLVEPSPAISIGSSYLPARVGRYIGYRIVSDYKKRHDIDLKDMLSPDFYNDAQILLKSEYSGS